MCFEIIFLQNIFLLTLTVILITTQPVKCWLLPEGGFKIWSSFIKVLIILEVMKKRTSKIISRNTVSQEITQNMCWKKALDESGNKLLLLKECLENVTNVRRSD